MDLSAYAGQLEGRVRLRITDRFNSPDNDEAATVVDSPLSFEIPCVGAGSPTGGSNCSVNTTANAVVAGSVQSGYRAIWELGQIEVYDGGSDGGANTTADNTVFMRQGVFVP
jgi:hypothetical protein